MSEVEVPMTAPGEIAGWPKLKVIYRTDADRISDLLPPGFTPGANPWVHINVYCVPVLDEPEFGVSTKIEADFDGMPGLYSLGMGIDQEAAVFNSQSMNGQPKFPCQIKFFRLGDTVDARCTHQGYTFFEFHGKAASPVVPAADVIEENEWWIKVQGPWRGGAPVRLPTPCSTCEQHTCRSVIRTTRGHRGSAGQPVDPYTELLPMREQVATELVTAQFRSREITVAGPLDPDAFWSHIDVIGGSRWPGERGGPRGGAH